MKEEIKSFLVIVVFVFICMCVGMYDGRLQMKKEAIERGCAEWGQQTGKFQWIGGE